MSTIFGIPADTLLVILLGIFGICLATGVWIFARHRAVFRIGIRNIPRRPAQTILIIIGLMLSTTIIAAALTTGDILDNTIRGDVFEVAGYTDELIVPAASADDEQARPQEGVTFPQDVVDHLREQLADDPNIDGLMPVFNEYVPAIHAERDLGEPVLTMVGLDFDYIDTFGGMTDIDGNSIDFDALGPNQVILGQRPSERLEAGPGDQLTIFIQNQPVEIEVAAVARDTLFTGMNDPGMPGGFAMTLDAAQAVADREGEIKFIAVTNAGGIEDGVALTDEVVDTVSDVLAGTELAIVPVKQQAVETAEQVATVFSSIFVVFGMFSIAAGILLIFLIFVLLAAERKPEMGISRAVGMKRRQLTQMFIAEGLAYDLAAAMVGALVGIGVAIVMVNFMTAIIGEDMFQLRVTATWRSLLIAYTLGVTVTFMTIVISAWRISRLNIVSAIRDLPDPEQKQRRLRGILLDVLGPIFSVVLVVAGYAALNPFLFGLGVSLLLFSLAHIATRLGVPSRLPISIAALLVVLYWLLPVRQTLNIAPDMGTGGMEMFVLSGMMLVTGATILIMWNADVITWLVATVSRRFSRWVPAVKTAVSYPMANRWRTGLTIAMFSLIIFSLVMMAAINANFTRAFEGEYAGGGWDIEIRQAPTNPIDDLRATLAEQGYDGPEATRAGKALQVDAFTTSLRLAGDEEWMNYQMVGADDDFFATARTEAPISIKATGYESSEQIWDAVRDNPNLAVIDRAAVPSPVMFMIGVDFQLTGLEFGDTTMDPMDVEIRNRATGDIDTVTIIGVIDPRVSIYFGMYVNESALIDLMGVPTSITHYAALADGSDATAAASAIERSLMTYGAQADATSDILAQANEESRSFLYLFEGFMALGLVVGIAALGVVSYRSVVERRQQIGMLRAIGYRRSMLAASFVLESTIVTGLGVLSGLTLGILLSWQLMQADAFSGTLGTAGYVIPWGQLLVFSAIALIASLLMTYIPARQAAQVPIASALRYE